MVQNTPEEMTRYQLRRAKRLITLDEIRSTNASKLSE